MMLASTLSRPRWAMPSTAESRPASAAPERISSRIGIADSAPSRPNRLVPTYFVARNFSNASAALSRSRMRSLLLLGEACGCTPSTWLWIQRCSSVLLDVHVLDADRAAVRVAQHAEQVAERCISDVPPTPPVRNSRSRSQIVRPYVAGSSSTGICGSFQRSGSRSAMRWPRTRWTRISVATCICLCSIASSLFDRVDVGAPLDRLVRHAEVVEDVLVEAVLAEQQLVDPLQEQPALGALDDAVVVGARDRDDLADAERRQVACWSAPWNSAG